VDIAVANKHVEVISKGERYSKEKYCAKLALIATGINYKLHKKLGLGYPKDFLKGVQAELNVRKVDCTHVYVGKDVAPGAFAWAVPVDGDKVRLGLMTDESPKQYFGNILKRFYPEGRMIIDKDRIQFKAIAQGLVSPTYGERVLTIGEAAGQVKTTTGGGIYFGLLCSDIASRVAIKTFEIDNFSKKVLAEYEKLWKRTIQKEILVGYYVRKICAKFNDAQLEKMFQVAQNDGVIPLIKEKGNFDWHRELVLTLMKKIPFVQILKARLANK
jgi:flavin-dependent dehydrogenase